MSKPFLAGPGPEPLQDRTGGGDKGLVADHPARGADRGPRRRSPAGARETFPGQEPRAGARWTDRAQREFSALRLGGHLCIDAAKATLPHLDVAVDKAVIPGVVDALVEWATEQYGLAVAGTMAKDADRIVAVVLEAAGVTLTEDTDGSD